MTVLFEVQVERTGFGYCCGVRVAASKPELAAEAAERIVAERFGGMSVLHQFFAYSVKALTGADFLLLTNG